MNRTLTIWTITNRFPWQSKGPLLKEGYKVELTWRDQAPSSVLIKDSEGEPVFNARVAAGGAPSLFQVERENGNNRRSDQMRGCFSILDDFDPPLLHGVLGSRHAISPGGNDDDDTEVFVATNNPDPIGQEE